MSDKRLHNLENKISYHFKNVKLLRQALTHPSYANEHRGLKSYQRLEFLGDAVLELITSEHLMKQDKIADEGTLTKRRIQIVRAESLAEAARAINLNEYILTNKGTEINDNILADVVEAVIGAVYSDGGLTEARKLIHRFILPINTENADYKSILQEKLGNKCDELHYEIIDESGSDHKKQFTAAAIFQGETIGQGIGRSKQRAEQAAAQNAIQRIHQMKTL